MPSLPSPSSTVFFLCDLQTRFRSLVYGFDTVGATANKMIKIAKVLNLPVVVTEQNSKALGSTIAEAGLDQLGPLHLATIEKSLFSMYTTEVESILKRHDFKSVVLFGIESHICVLQSALDLLDNGYDVHVLADGVSSCNKEEIPYALARMRQAGAQITTSESVAFQLQRDADKPNFKSFAAIIKNEQATTQKALETLMSHES